MSLSPYSDPSIAELLRGFEETLVKRLVRDTDPDFYDWPLRASALRGCWEVRAPVGWVSQDMCSLYTRVRSVDRNLNFAICICTQGSETYTPPPTLRHIIARGARRMVCELPYIRFQRAMDLVAAFRADGVWWPEELAELQPVKVKSRRRKDQGIR